MLHIYPSMNLEMDLLFLVFGTIQNDPPAPQRLCLLQLDLFSWRVGDRGSERKEREAATNK
jgi:hypothetical protein